MRTEVEEQQTFIAASKKSTTNNDNQQQTTTINNNDDDKQQAVMSSSSVWVQLYYKGNDEPVGNPIFIKTASLDPPVIAALAETVKVKMAEELTHCSAAKLVVYPPDTKPPFLQDKAIDPGDDVPPGTTSKNPLIVVAPLPPNGEKIFWHLVTGTIERNYANSGSRHELFKCAGGGYYPQEMAPDDAFAVALHPTDVSKRLLSVSVVFSTLHAAEAFIVRVDNYISKTHGISYRTSFTTTQVQPYDKHQLVLESDYVANEPDGEAPHDSPVWNVEVSSMDISVLSPTTVFSKSDTAYKYQRIETEAAFARSVPESAHIFPKAKCKGKYEWLDKPTFNRLALSRDGHKHYDGTANGQGVTAETSTVVALEPTTTDRIKLDHATFTRISNRLWCRNNLVANSWRAFLKPDVKKIEEGDHLHYSPIYLYCESNRKFVMQFEQQQNSNGTFQDVCLTAIPGVEDHTTLNTWNEQERTVAVSEIMECLLRWNYNDTRRIWREMPGEHAIAMAKQT